MNALIDFIRLFGPHEPEMPSATPRFSTTEVVLLFLLSYLVVLVPSLILFTVRARTTVLFATVILIGSLFY
jgi:hypothetical protein